MKKWLNRLEELAEDWYYLVKNQGWTEAGPIIADEIVSLPYRHLKFFLVARSLREPLLHFPTKAPLEIRPFEAKGLELVRDISRPSEARLFAQRLEQGQQGLLALYKGQPAGFAWGCAEVNHDLDNLPLTLEPGDMLCVDVYTNPAFRGKGIHTALTLARFQLFHDLGFRRAVAYIKVNNYPSLAVWRKMGAEVVGQIDFKRLGPWRWGGQRPETQISLDYVLGSNGRGRRASLTKVKAANPPS